MATDIQEYILIISGKVYRVYAYNEKQAINVFDNLCRNYISKGSTYEEYWKEMLSDLQEKRYVITHNLDFKGVREIN